MLIKITQSSHCIFHLCFIDLLINLLLFSFSDYLSSYYNITFVAESLCFILQQLLSSYYYRFRESFIIEIEIIENHFVAKLCWYYCIFEGFRCHCRDYSVNPSIAITAWIIIIIDQLHYSCTHSSMDRMFVTYLLVIAYLAG